MAGKVGYVNRQGAELMGFHCPEDVLGSDVTELWSPNGSGISQRDLSKLVLTGRQLAHTHVLLKQAGGELVDVELSLARLTYEGEPAVQCVVRDISERVAAQETIQRMAYYDPLTDLPNRTLFNDHLRSALAQAKRRNETVAVVFVDLDDFKAINDSLGHTIGDGVLKAVGERLTSLLRAEDTVARQSGDEFTVIARIADRCDVGLLADRILESIREGFNVDGHELHVSASLGVATYPHDGVTETELIKNADAAMYTAKEWGVNTYRLYSPDMGDSIADRLELQAGLSQALERDELELYYQPQVDMRDGSLVGVEALLRWNHPSLGMLLPRSFLELAEQAGFMGEIGKWVLEQACTQASTWHHEHRQFGRMAVNLSAREFVQQDIVENVARALTRTGLPPEMLELEITETIAMYNVEQILAILRLLRDTGVRVAIDDFGTGYSSMSYLKRFPVQTLKIAQTFMRDVHIDLQSAAIASMLISLCRELDLDIVAEGVEHPSQLEFLRERGCYVIQGHIFSAPLAAADLEAFLDAGVVVA
jgi:diguanylate cyclase (GGDEF)-like protein/PAS domain S-box-containing protein